MVQAHVRCLSSGPRLTSCAAIAHAEAAARGSAVARCSSRLCADPVPATDHDGEHNVAVLLYSGAQDVGGGKVCQSDKSALIGSSPKWCPFDWRTQS